MSDAIPRQNGRGSHLRHVGSLSVEMPADWLFKESYTFLAPDGQANLIVSTEPLDAETDVVLYAGTQGDLLRAEFPGYVELNGYEVSIEGLPGPVYLREFRWAPEGKDPVAQMQIYAVHRENGRPRGITATATAPLDRYPDHRETLFRGLRSIVHRSTRAGTVPAAVASR